MLGRIYLETVAFEDNDGKTRVTARLVFQAVEDRDGMLQSGMEKGAVETMERLAGVLANG